MNELRDAVLAVFVGDDPPPVPVARLIADVAVATGWSRLEVQQAVYTLIATGVLTAGTGRELDFRWGGKRDHGTYAVPADVAQRRTAEHRQYLFDQRVNCLRYPAQGLATEVILRRHADEWRDVVEAEMLRTAPADFHQELADHLERTRQIDSGGRAQVQEDAGVAAVAADGGVGP